MTVEATYVVLSTGGWKLWPEAICEDFSEHTISCEAGENPVFETDEFKVWS